MYWISYHFDQNLVCLYVLHFDNFPTNNFSHIHEYNSHDQKVTL